MRTAIAVAGRVVVRRIRDHLDDDLEGLLLTGRYMRIEQSVEHLSHNDRDGSGRSCRAIEAEHQVLIRAAGLGHGLSRLCGF